MSSIEAMMGRQVYVYVACSKSSQTQVQSLEEWYVPQIRRQRIQELWVRRMASSFGIFQSWRKVMAERQTSCVKKRQSG